MFILEAIGIVAFAVAGATEAIRARLDLFGVTVSAIVTAIGGGVIRDILLGVHPPVGMATWWYLVACTATAMLVFCLYPRLTGHRLLLQAADAIGLALFAVTGTTKAMELATPVHVATMIGMLNGVGGGVLRDMLLRRIPSVLRVELYALPALAGSLILALDQQYHLLPNQMTTLVAMLIIFTTRMAAVLFDWNLPVRRTKETKPKNLLPEDGAERTLPLPRFTATHSPMTPPHVLPTKANPAPRQAARHPPPRDRRPPGNRTPFTNQHRASDVRPAAFRTETGSTRASSTAAHPAHPPTGSPAQEHPSRRRPETTQAGQAPGPHADRAHRSGSAARPAIADPRVHQTEVRRAGPETRWTSD
ncbi:trimeric intracellular cation channel family protein [Lentzea flava]|uniref:Glycine transporter domain-containing protein n=1 Tax=Lentzea flava TaxID=103732 RepID=A0ABQ2VGF5_9PSEU|nr:trimeric intracellular cation channel family protein [Lentzea flava]GGU85781.1 hypothetical protein GCM10010178_89880 [Lentzea flava]